MAILVTGGAGYIGSHVAYELVDASRDVIVLDNLSTGFAGAVPSSARLVIGDIADEALLCKVHPEHGIDAIIHMAGSVVVPESITDPLGCYLNDTARSRTLTAFAVAAGIRRFIFSSRGLRNTSAIPVGEDAPLRPVSRYGTSKMMTELMLGDTAKAHDLRYVALRYFNVAGADPAGRTGQSTRGATHLVKVACEAATGRRDGIDVFGMDYPTRDGTCIRDFIHAKDLALAHSRRSPLASGEQRTVTDAELRLFKRLLRPRGDQSSGASIGARAHGARRSQAPQRRHRDRRRLSPAALRAQLDSAPRRHRWHRAGCLALGARIGRQLAAVAVPHVC